MSPTHIKKGNTDLKKINILKKPLALMLALIMAFCLGFTACDSSAGTKNAEKIPILTYHKIVPEGTEFSNGLLIAADTFDKEMKYLHDNGYTTLTLDEFYDWYTGKTEVPEKSVVVTFDDGYYGAYHLAYPIIKNMIRPRRYSALDTISKMLRRSLIRTRQKIITSALM